MVHEFDEDDLFEEIAEKKAIERQSKELNSLLKQLYVYLKKDDDSDSKLLSTIICSSKDLSVLLGEVKKMSLSLDKPVPAPQVIVNTDIKSLALAIDKLSEKQQTIIDNQRKLIEINSLKPTEMEAIRNNAYGIQQINTIKIKYETLKVK